MHGSGCSLRAARHARTILWKFAEPQPKSFSVSPEFMEKVFTPLAASF